MKACDYLGKNGEGCNLCCVFDFPYLILNKQQVPTKLAGKPSTKQRKLALKMGVHTPRNARFCAYSVNGKCTVYDTNNPIVVNVCKQFHCDAFDKFEKIIALEKRDIFLEDIKEIKSQEEKVDYLNKFKL